MSDDPKPLIEEVLKAQRAILAALQNSDPSDWLHLELTMGQLKGVFAIAQHGPLSVGQLAELLGVTLPAASTLVERLVKERLVLRREDSADRRRMIIQLTTKGEQLILQLLQGNQERFCGWLVRLNGEDLKALAQGLAALAAIVSDPIHSTSPA